MKNVIFFYASRIFMWLDKKLVEWYDRTRALRVVVVI